MLVANYTKSVHLTASIMHEVYESSGFMDAIALQKRKTDMGHYASSAAKRSRQKKANKSNPVNSPTRPTLSPSESSKVIIKFLYIALFING